MQFLGLPLVYGFQELGNTCGGVSPKCGAVVGQQAFWWGAQEFYAYNGAVTQDLPTVLGVVICTATCVALANLVVDIVYAFLDPRVRYA